MPEQDVATTHAGDAFEGDEMPDWAVDSSGLRRAHAAGLLAHLSPSQRLWMSPLTWLPAGTAFASAMRPEICFPDPGIDPPDTPTLFSPPSSSAVEICNVIEELHGAHGVVLAEGSAPNLARTLEVEQAWKSAGGLARLTDESIAALLVADLEQLPLVAEDSSVLRVGRHLQLSMLTVDQFASYVAA